MSAVWMCKPGHYPPHERNPRCAGDGCQPVAVVAYEDREHAEGVGRHCHWQMVDAVRVLSEGVRP